MNKDRYPIGTWFITNDLIGVIVEVYQREDDGECSIMFIDEKGPQIFEFLWWEIERWISENNIQVDIPDEETN